MDIPARNHLWNIFYTEILAEILITGHIISPSLKRLVEHQNLNNTYIALLVDLKTFFDTGDIGSVCGFFNKVMKEQEKIAYLTNTTA